MKPIRWIPLAAVLLLAGPFAGAHPIFIDILCPAPDADVLEVVWYSNDYDPERCDGDKMNNPFCRDFDADALRFMSQQMKVFLFWSENEPQHKDHQQWLDTMEGGLEPFGRFVADVNFDGLNDLVLLFDRPQGEKINWGGIIVDNFGEYSEDGKRWGYHGIDPIEVGFSCVSNSRYWSLHSAEGPLPLDEVWNELPLFHNTVFYNSGQTYLDVLRTSPSGGNYYYILAHQFIAAQLNMLGGAACSVEALMAFNEAKTILGAEGFTPEYVSGLAGAERRQMLLTILRLSRTLIQYNYGRLGPVRCGE